MKLKRCLSVISALFLLLPLVACNHTPTTPVPDPTAATTTTVTTAATTTTAVTTVTEPATTVATEAPTTTVPNAPATTPNGTRVTTTKTTRTYVTRSLPTTVTATRPLTMKPTSADPTNYLMQPVIGSSASPKIGSQNFGGKTFSFADFGALGTIPVEQIDAFEAAHNAIVTVEYIPTATYLETLVSAKLAGKPYDIIRLHSSQYPEPITAGILQPLETYISRGDLWNTATKSGFSWNMMYATSLSGHIYTVGGNYRQALSVIYYNKKDFAAAGYTGASDPLALYNTGTWDWQTLYDMLLAIQRPNEGVYGINSPVSYWHDQFLNSYNTNLINITKDGRFIENLSDPNMYEAYEMLRKYCYGEQKVIHPNDMQGSGQDQFLSGTTVALVSDTMFYGTALAEIPKQAVFDNTPANLGVVPLPNYKNAPHSVWAWDGFGAGAGASKEGVLCALAFAKYDSANNHANAYQTVMPAELKTVVCNILDSDNLIAPYNGFNSSAGDLSNLGFNISNLIGINGQNITTTLKNYKKIAQTIIDTALKS